VLSGKGLCDKLITRPEKSYRLWCVVVCDLENLKNEEAMTRVESQRQREREKKLFYSITSDAKKRITLKGVIKLNLKKEMQC